MKTLTTLLSLLLVINTSFSQNSNNTFNYSEIARNATGEPILNSEVQVQIAIHFGTNTSLASYIENHTSQTDNNGEITVVIGAGTPISGEYSELPWGIKKSYIETFINGISVSNKEVKRPRNLGVFNSLSKIATNKTQQTSVNQNVLDMASDGLPLQQLQLGDKVLIPGQGIMFKGKTSNYPVEVINLITITAGAGVEISGTYPNLVIGLKKHYIGEEYLGGKVGYVDETGQHGFVVYPNLLGPANWQTFPWGHQRANTISADDFIAVGNDNEAIGYGWGNTLNLIKRDNTDLNVWDIGEEPSIPQILDNFDNNKWFLPSKEELKQIYKNRGKLGFIGNQYNKFIWSSNVDIGHYIYKGHNDRYNGTSVDPNQNEPHNQNTRIYEKMNLKTDDKVVGVKCLNFSNGNSVSILGAYEHYFFVIREF